MTDSWLPEDPTEVIGEPEPSPPDAPTVATAPVKRRSRGGWWLRLTARTGLSLVSVVVLTATGYAWATYHTINSDITRSNAIAEAEGTTVHSLNGDTNILIMGLDTRLDENGNPLDPAIYNALHAGDPTVAQGEDANVLMVLHVPGDGSQATALSIPRDDMVSIPGCPDGECRAKIKEAYGLAMDQETKKLINQGVPAGAARVQQAREAGREAEIATVREFLGGIPIDHFVEVTLIAFFELAKVVQPITVCLNENTSDVAYSGAKFHQGYQQIDAQQAVAFVRQRRDPNTSLEFTDLDRERRQQAFISSVAYQLKQAGTFADPSKLSGILSVAEANIAVDSGLDLLTFASEATNLTGGNITFYTLPIEGYSPPGGESYNIVDVPKIQAIVRQLIPSDFGGTATTSGTATPGTTPGATPATAATTTAPATNAVTDVVNETGHSNRGGLVQSGLSTAGFTRGSTSTPGRYTHTSVVYYGPGAASAAQAAAGLLGISAVESDSAVAAGTLRILLGTDFSLPDSMTGGSGEGTTTTVPATSISVVPANSGGTAGPSISSLTALSGGGVPCVK